MGYIVLQLLIGTVPLWVGYVLNAIITVMPIPIAFISLLLLFLWMLLCYRSCVPHRSPIAQAAYLSGFGFVMLLLVAYQTLIRGSMWVSWFGLATQIYFLPGLLPAATILSPFIKSTSMLLIMAVEMVMLFLLALTGCMLKAKKFRK